MEEMSRVEERSSDSIPRGCWWNTEYVYSEVSGKSGIRKTDI